MATDGKSRSAFYVSKITPSPSSLRKDDSSDSKSKEMEGSTESTGSCDGHVTSDIRIEVPTVNGHLTASDQSAPPLSSSSSLASGVGSPTTEERTSSASSNSSLHSSDQRYASREALIEQLQADLSNPTASSEGNRDKEIITQLLEHIVSLKMEIETLREDNKRLNSLRTDMDDELHTLTENLFEEAYKMVDEAKGGKVSAEKRLADAAGKIDAMETEMSALKNLLHVPGRDSPDDPHDSPSTHHKHHRPASVKKVLKKITKKSSSTKVSKSRPGSSTSLTPPQVTPLTQHRSGIHGESLVEGEISPDDFESFKAWLDGLATGLAHPYLATVIDVDVRPCLKFHSQQISDQVLEAARENNLLMETLCGAQETRQCALSANDNVCCTHRLKLSTSDDWYYISQWCRDRIAAACDFYMYIGHIQKGIVKLDETKLYWQVRKLRAMMSLARLSLKLPE